jgi:hypothetical protein
MDACNLVRALMFEAAFTAKENIEILSFKETLIPFAIGTHHRGLTLCTLPTYPCAVFCQLRRIIYLIYISPIIIY